MRPWRKRLRAEIVRDASVELGRERRRAVEVIGVRLDELVGRMGPQPCREHAVQPRPLRLRQASVRDVADEDVAEAIRDLAGHRRQWLARQQLPVDEVGERGVHVELGIELADRAAPEDAADDRAVPQDGA